MESILTSIKTLLGITEECKDFDVELVATINSVLADLTQMGVGPSKGFYIEDSSTIWDDFISDNLLLQSVKSYMHLRVKLLFDPGSIGASTLASYERQISQWECRLNLVAEGAFGKINDPEGPSGDYTKLKNLQSINGETLIGNYDEKDPNVIEMSESDVKTMWNALFDGK